MTEQLLCFKPLSRAEEIQWGRLSVKTYTTNTAELRVRSVCVFLWGFCSSSSVSCSECGAVGSGCCVREKHPLSFTCPWHLSVSFTDNIVITCWFTGRSVSCSSGLPLHFLLRLIQTKGRKRKAVGLHHVSLWFWRLQMFHFPLQLSQEAKFKVVSRWK